MAQWDIDPPKARVELEHTKDAIRDIRPWATHWATHMEDAGRNAGTLAMDSSTAPQTWIIAAALVEFAQAKEIDVSFVAHRGEASVMGAETALQQYEHGDEEMARRTIHNALPDPQFAPLQGN